MLGCGQLHPPRLVRRPRCGVDGTKAGSGRAEWAAHQEGGLGRLGLEGGESEHSLCAEALYDRAHFRLVGISEFRAKVSHGIKRARRPARCAYNVQIDLPQ